MYLKKPDLKLKEGEKCRIASLLTSKRKCKQYFISKSSFFVLSCGSILYALSSAVLFAFTSSVSIHIYSLETVEKLLSTMCTVVTSPYLKRSEDFSRAD